MASPRVVVLVLNYNGGATLEECLRSLQETTYPNSRLVVLDNGSTDGSAEIAKRMEVETRLYGENLGYCAAYNRAFREFSEGAYLLLSNADLIVPSPTVECMVAAAAEDETVGFVGPVQRHADTGEIRSAGIQWRCGMMPRHVLRLNRPYNYVEGAFLLVRRTVLEKLGGLDEGLALNMEDVEWQARAAESGFRSVIAQDAVVLHTPPSKERVMTGAYYQTRNACIVTARYCGYVAQAVLRLRLLLEGLLGQMLGRPRGPLILEGLRDFRRGVRGMRQFH